MTLLAKFTGRIAGVLEWIVRYTAIAILVSLVCIVFFQVAHRMATDKSFVEIEELSITLAAWVAFLTVAYAARRRVHVRIEVFIEKLPFGMRNTIELLIYTAVCAATILLAWHGWGLAGRKMMIPMMVLPFKQGVQFYAYPIGMGLTAFFMLDHVLQTIRRFATKEPYVQADPVAEAPEVDGETALSIMNAKED